MPETEVKSINGRTVCDQTARTNANGKYAKPAGGIPAADLAADVQESLDKADSALQEHQSLTAYRTAAAQDEIDGDKLNAYTSVEFTVDNSRVDASGVIVDSTGAHRTDYISCVPGDTIRYTGNSFICGGDSVMSLLAFYSPAKVYISSVNKFGTETSSTPGTITATVPAGAAYFIASTNGSTAPYHVEVFDISRTVAESAQNVERIDARLAAVESTKISQINLATSQNFASSYHLRSADGIISQTDPEHETYARDYPRCHYKIRGLNPGGYVLEYIPVVAATNDGARLGVIKSDDSTIFGDISITNLSRKYYRRFTLSEMTDIGIWAKQYDGTGKYAIYRDGDGELATESQIAHLETQVRSDLDAVIKSRYIKGTGSANPITILHSSDVHGDSNAIKRMGDIYRAHTDLFDGAICTGDLVANDSTESVSWWDSDVMICIGNHDSAVYNGGTYNWTALSMAERAEKYIEPHEARWNITRESRKSYYYKDYAAARVRLAVIDIMLYAEADATHGSTQNAWLGTLMDEATTLGYHVLIACHAPRTGSVAIPCSFTERRYATMPSDTTILPDSVVDLVSAKITAGCTFVGYIAGHVHNDFVWDVAGDGSNRQIMYCIASANQRDRIQHRDGDLGRTANYDIPLDVFNAVTIDTEHTLIKIVRIGGANLADRMTRRDYLAVNYSTGVIVSESVTSESPTPTPTPTPGRLWKPEHVRVAYGGPGIASNAFYIEEADVSGGNLYFKIAANSLHFYWNGQQITRTNAQLISELGSAAETTTRGQQTDCLIIPDKNCLAFNMTAKKFHYVLRTSVGEDDIVLFHNAYGRAESPHAIIQEWKMYKLAAQIAAAQP